MSKRIYLSPPHMGGKELKYINEAFESNWIAPLGKNVDHFEQALADFCNVRHAAALTTGTAAIHLALILLDVQPGDYVICQSFTFCATANPIRYLGATPVFVDSEKDTWNMDPDFLEQSILDCIGGKIIINGKRGKAARPKAIIPVHLYGMPAKMENILGIAGKYGIPVIEDAAEALGSRYKNKPVGSFGDFSILSFNGNKIITTSGGGALLSNDKSKIERARYLATQARDPAPHYQHSTTGYNYRMSNILAGIGRGQLEVLTERIELRRNVFRAYYENLKETEGISFHLEPDDDFFSNRWLTSISIDPSKTGFSSEDLRLSLEKEDIESRPFWKPLHLQPVFAGFPCYLTGVSEQLFRKGLCLPSGSNLIDKDLERILHLIKSFRK